MNDFVDIRIIPYREEYAMTSLRWITRSLGNKVLQQLWKIKEGNTERTEWRDVGTVIDENLNY